jgi:DNA-binding winged helix-turn-helix (wHTH) protein/TolB-like protein
LAVDRFRFGEFEFDAGSGELCRVDGTDGPQRLPPQPARLLALLVERRGDLVTRDEIRESIWPGVEVEFDSSLHFCIRQIRAALGDSAGNPRYVETLPRRGYRLIPAVDAVGDAPEPAERGRRRWPLALALTLIPVAVIAFVISGVGTTSHGVPAVRVAIMPFEPPTDSDTFGDVGPIADWILDDLTRTAGDRAGIVGPSTTIAYTGSVDALKRLAADYDLDYIVNGRYLDGEHGPRMLAELIRLPDGAHVWVEAYVDLAEDRRIGLEISAAVADELDLGD